MRGRVVSAVLGGGVSLLLVAALVVFALSSPVSGDSMNPGLRSGDRVLALDDTPERLDVVTLRPPGGSATVVRRVIGVPGDQVRITGSDILVRPGGGEWLAVARGPGDPGVCCAPDGRGGTDGAVEVPPGRYFVLGDNLTVSTDSRTYGFVPEADVTGVVWRRVWPVPRFDAVRVPALSAVPVTGP
ncbi:signal peptidase I [Saccharothrix longispora]|uniref:signal peptidase I n=1 Tax=Saccharothrix longispora TaxID=33920 RepID=UPI0028FD1B5B|nr:signal peptidase I [Saccharothrix longispora]MBY8847359.1 signal peptidase I [Saccharothrix sp. MB29]MDU0289260.1 signal peptidase I [Saccharothrix longispora]